MRLLKGISGFSLLTESLETNEMIKFIDDRLVYIELKSAWKPPARNGCSSFSWM